MMDWKELEVPIRRSIQANMVIVLAGGLYGWHMGQDMFVWKVVAAVSALSWVMGEIILMMGKEW